jgi:hypothetical protein
MKDEKIDKHESYGMIKLGRTTGGQNNLFGSSIQHSNVIRLNISPAELHRGLGRDYYHPRGEIIEIEMSPTQFTELITNMNTIGVPCTIKHINRKRMENPPSANKKQQFEDEFSEDMKKLALRMSELTEKAEKILSNKKSPNKSEREDVLSDIRHLQTELISNIPFMYRCFNEQMDKTVTEAKGEVEAFVTNKITSLGIKALKEEFNTKLLEE